MKPKPPPDRRKFANLWDELGYLYDKVLYWLYQRQEPQRARAYAERLDKALLKADREQQAIWGQECRALVYESKGDLPRAIAHRRREIALIKRLHDITPPNDPHRDTILARYGDEDLSDRLDLLAVLHHDSGELDKAITTLQESKRLCQKRGIRFDGDDLLAEYLEEKHAEPAKDGAGDGAARHARQRRLTRA